MTYDFSLVHRARELTTGANNHRAANLLANYISACESKNQQAIDRHKATLQDWCATQPQRAMWPIMPTMFLSRVESLDAQMKCLLDEADYRVWRYHLILGASPALICRETRITKWALIRSISRIESILHAVEAAQAAA
jgi:hypothetical protein